MMNENELIAKINEIAKTEISYFIPSKIWVAYGQKRLYLNRNGKQSAGFIDLNTKEAHLNYNHITNAGANQIKELLKN